MLQLLSTYWLWALTGLLVPVLIHLWNKKQPQVIKVGSIRWLQAAASQQTRRLQLNDLPLLLLRCLILIILILFLCQPVLQQFIRQPGQKYVWVAPSLLQPQTLPLVQATIDSLLKKNYQLREFAIRFQVISEDSWQNLKNGKENKPIPESNINYWALAKAVNHHFPRAQEHLILTDNQLGHFAGKRPVSSHSSRWLTIPLNRTDSLFVQEAFQYHPDSLKVVIGQRNTGGVRFANFSFPIAATGQTLTPAGLPPLVYARKPNQEFISFQNSPEQVPVRKTRINISLFYDKDRQQDSKYLRAALAAVSDYAGRPINLTQISVARKINFKDTNWLFWLSDQPLPATIQKEINKGLVIFKDAPATQKFGAANYITMAQLPVNIPLSQQVLMVQKAGSSVWQNNFGELVLAYKAIGKGGLYTFSSRFNGQWNNLPESSFFPELLSNLILPETKIRRDLRELDNDQVQPILAKTTQQKNFLRQVQRELEYLFLALGALLFLTERFWAFRKGRRQI
ncbi:MAG: hypothetical protein JWQ14_2369 [Adhaeribacter sp.]|nr:hypothetical protein [Adhaeribacter sp.]